MVARPPLSLGDLEESPVDGVRLSVWELAGPSGRGDNGRSLGVTVRIVDLIACPNALIEFFLDCVLRAATLPGR